LCKEIYHCTPEELEEVDANKAELHLYIYSLFVEKENKEAKEAKNNK